MEQMLCNTDCTLILQPGVRGWAGQSVTALCKTRILLLAQIWAIILQASQIQPGKLLNWAVSIHLTESQGCVTQLFIGNTVTLSNRTLLAEDLFYPLRGHASGSQSPNGPICLLLSGL